MTHTWKTLIEKEFTLTGDTWDDVVFSVPSVKNLETNPYDEEELRMWTEKFVYFVHAYDGMITVQYVLRNPTERCEENQNYSIQLTVSVESKPLPKPSTTSPQRWFFIVLWPHSQTNDNSLL